jgi:hypothetical protein
MVPGEGNRVRAGDGLGAGAGKPYTCPSGARRLRSGAPALRHEVWT